MEVLPHPSIAPIHLAPLSFSLKPQMVENYSTDSPLFFTTLPQDQYLALLIELGITDNRGIIKKDYQNFKLPPLDKETIEYIHQSLNERLKIIGSRLGCPLNIELTRRQIFNDAKRKAGQLNVNHSQLVKYHGSDFQSKLSFTYKENVFSSFFDSFKEQVPSQKKHLLIPSNQSSLKPHDADYQINPRNSNPIVCNALIDSLVDLFTKQLKNIKCSLVSTYLQTQLQKIYNSPTNPYLYLKSVFTNPQEIFNRNHSKLLPTLIKVDAFIQASNVNSALEDPQFKKNVFFIRSFGDRKEKKTDVVYLVSNARQGIFAFHTLSVYIDPLLENPIGFPEMIPFTPNGNDFQFFSDNHADLLTSIQDVEHQAQAYEEADFERYILACSTSKRCLIVGKGKNSLEILINHAREQEQDLSTYLAAKLIKMAKSHLIKSPEQVIALTFLTCLLLFEQDAIYQKDIKLICQKIFQYLDTSKDYPIQCVFVNALRSALESPLLSFENILDQLQDSCYIALNLSSSLHLTPINHEKPSIRIQFPSYSFLIPYQPLRGLNNLSHIQEPLAWEALQSLHKGLTSFISFQNFTSLLKPYCDHSDSHFREVKEQALSLLNHPHPLVKHQACLKLLACLSQKFEENILEHLFIHSLDLNVFQALLYLCKGHPAEIFLVEGSQIHAAFHELFAKSIEQRLECQNHLVPLLFNTKNPFLIQVALGLYKHIFHQLSKEQKRASIIQNLKCLGFSHIFVSFDLVHFIHTDPLIGHYFKFKIWISLTSALIKALDKSYLAQSPRVILLFESLSCEILNVLKNPLFALNDEPIRYSEAINWLVSQSLKSQQFEKAYQLILEGLKHKILLPDEFLASDWHTLACYYLNLKQDSFGVSAYTCWTKGETYGIWDYLQPELKKQFLLQLAQKNPDNQTMIFEQLISPSSCQGETNKQVSFLFLQHIQTELNAKSLLLENILFSFTHFIQNSSSFHSDEELKIIFALSHKMRHLCLIPSINQKHIQLFSQFLSDLISHRYSEHLGRVFLELLTHYVEEKSSPMLSILLEKAFVYLYQDQSKKTSSLTLECYQKFFKLFNQAFLKLQTSLDPLPLHLKKKLQDPALQTLLDHLNCHQLYADLFPFLVNLSHWQLNLSFPGKYTVCALTYSQTFPKKSKDLIKQYLKTYITLSSKPDASLGDLYLYLAKECIEAKESTEAKKWIEQSEKIQKNPAIYVLVLQNALSLIQNGHSELSLEQFHVMRGCTMCTFEIESVWVLLMEEYFNRFSVFECMQLLLESNIFHHPCKDVSLIEKILNKSLNELALPPSDKNTLSKRTFSKNWMFFIDVLKKFAVSDGKIWIQFIKLSHACESTEFKNQAFNLLFQQRDLSAETLLTCWKAVLENFKQVGYKKIVDLLKSTSLIKMMEQIKEEEKSEILPLLSHVFLVTLCHENLSRKLLMAGIKNLKFLGFRPQHFKDMQDRLNWCQALVLMQQEDEVREAITIGMKVLKELAQVEDLIVYPFVKQLILYALEHADIKIQVRELLQLLKNFPSLPLPYAHILSYLSSYPTEFNEEKFHYLFCLFTYPMQIKEEIEEKELILLLCQQLLDQSQEVFVRQLLRHSNISLFLEEKEIKEFKSKALSQTFRSIGHFFARLVDTNQGIGFMMACNLALVLLVIYTYSTEIETEEKAKEFLLRHAMAYKK